MDLRMNPTTGQLAQRLPAAAGTDPGWFVWAWESSTITTDILGDADLVDWVRAEVTAVPDEPVFLFAVGCVDCQPDHEPASTPLERERHLAYHAPGHATAPYAVKAVHPHYEPDAEPEVGDTVTFFGSTTAQVVGFVHAEVTAINGATAQITAEHDHRLLVPLTALAYLQDAT
jgi:hypothetical protein